nr:hypothetical protein [Desulfosoma caldarium]
MPGNRLEGAVVKGGGFPELVYLIIGHEKFGNDAAARLLNFLFGSLQGM